MWGQFFFLKASYFVVCLHAFMHRGAYEEARTKSGPHALQLTALPTSLMILTFFFLRAVPQRWVPSL